MRQDLIIIGDGKQAELAYRFLEDDSREYDLFGFAVEREFRKHDTLFGLPVRDLEESESWGCSFYAAISFARLNGLRTRLVNEAKSRGMTPITFVHSSAAVSPDAVIGEHVFICPLNNIDPCVTIGDNVYLHAANHIGHHSVIEDNVFIASGVTISGGCRIGANTFIGVNAAVGHGVTIGAGCIIGAGTLITRDVPAGSVVKRTSDMPEPDRTASEVKL